MASKLNYFPDFHEAEILNGTVPELSIDKEILCKEKVGFKANNHKVYTINGDLFYEDDRHQYELQEFWLELNDQNEDYEDLVFEIKQNSFVVMVNSIILLSCYQWNTIMDEYPPKCLVCNIIIQDAHSHVKTEKHMINLEKHKPLKKFDLHITRLIGDQYHCAVCNEVYEMYDNTHLDSERHLERMLYATNRATDGLFDFEINKDNSSLINDNSSVNNDNNERKKDTLSTSESGFDSDGFYDLNYFTNNKSALRSYASIVKESLKKTQTSLVEHALANNKMTIESDTYNMIVRPNSKEFYCMLCILFGDVTTTSVHCESEEHLKKLKQCEIMDIHDEHFIRKVTTKFYHCGTCNNLQFAGAVEAHLETHKKKHENNHKEKEQDNKTNKNIDEGSVQKNKINENSNKENVQENKLNDNSNKENVQKNKINENRDSINVQENKINKNSNTGNVQENKINENSDTGNNTNVNNNHVFDINQHRPQNIPPNVHSPGPSTNNRNPIYGDIIINRFNYNIRVSILSYNLICRRLADYICLLCNFVSPDMTLHLRDPRHIVCLENFPFQPFFGIHLVRLIQQYAHCAICNVLVDVAVIHLHTSCQPHLFMLNKALNPSSNTMVIYTTNNDSIQSVNTKQTTEIISQSENVQAITNPENLHQASIETATNQATDSKQIEIDLDNLEYNSEDDLDILQEFVYLKIKKSLIKVSYVSYNTLVNTGDGNRYCFVCSYKINKSLHGHIKSKAHMNRMNKCKFIMNYEKDLLRQVKLTYHCCVCNVLVRKSDIKNHLAWPVHKENAKFLKLRKHVHLNNIINVEYQTKDACFNETEPQIQLVFKMMCGKKTIDNIGGIVMNIPPNEESRGKILNISWDAWQGITRYEGGVQCNLCHTFFIDIDPHLEEDKHKKLVSTPIEKQYLPACIRKISNVELNCVTCNLVFSSKGKSISQHMGGRKHLGNYEEILQTAFTDMSFT